MKDIFQNGFTPTEFRKPFPPRRSEQCCRLMQLVLNLLTIWNCSFCSFTRRMEFTLLSRSFHFLYNRAFLLSSPLIHFFGIFFCLFAFFSAVWFIWHLPLCSAHTMYKSNTDKPAQFKLFTLQCTWVAVQQSAEQLFHSLVSSEITDKKLQEDEN